MPPHRRRHAVDVQPAFITVSAPLALTCINKQMPRLGRLTSGRKP
jgi:hypothetical protein